ncbi:MAG TPA: hypothetical protein V6D17_16545, partial [Candidatus Obscuribacterales bacterium]
KFKRFDDQLDWLSGMKSDDDFLNKLTLEVDRHCERTFDTPRRELLTVKIFRRSVSGFKERLSSATTRIMEPRKEIASLKSRTASRIKRLKDKTKSATSYVAARTFTDHARKLFHQNLSALIGDSFNYFARRGSNREPGPIAALVKEAIELAERRRDLKRDPRLIVVAHSMGGNILCDLVSSFDLNARIDVLVTVGSQFPLFADLNMFPGLDSARRPIKKPEKVGKWINIFDSNDLLGYAATPLFEDIIDVEFGSGRLGVATHTDYFLWLSFYERLARVVQEQGSLVESGA